MSNSSNERLTVMTAHDAQVLLSVARVFEQFALTNLDGQAEGSRIVADDLRRIAALYHAGVTQEEATQVLTVAILRALLDADDPVAEAERITNEAAR